ATDDLIVSPPKFARFLAESFMPPSGKRVGRRRAAARRAGARVADRRLGALTGGTFLAGRSTASMPGGRSALGITEGVWISHDDFGNSVSIQTEEGSSSSTPQRGSPCFGDDFWLFGAESSSHGAGLVPQLL